MSVAIKVENLSKAYTISHKDGIPTSARESLEGKIRRLFRLPGHNRARLPSSINGSGTEVKEQFRALKDISFEVQHGDRFAIIGQNGAGKSTLLKILSRIVGPTSGRIEISGRISSLLEVGTGFHPELSGRENIFLNGAVLGMPRSEIRKKFDEIVDFAEIDQFLDTPVKFYSSGMYVRLAFAVAAHLDPEILILDEVLAVGDMRFQQKCLDKMRYASHEGRTILFVSHNMQSVTQICPTCILLEKGEIRASGNSADVINEYIGSAFVTGMESKSASLAEYHGTNDDGDKFARLVKAAVKDSDGLIQSTLPIHKDFFIEVVYEILSASSLSFVPNFHFYNVEGTLVFIATPPNGLVDKYEDGKYKVSCKVPRNLLNEGVFRVLVGLSSWDETLRIHFAATNALTLRIVDEFGDISYRNGYMHAIPGLIRAHFDWDVDKLA